MKDHSTPVGLKTSPPRVWVTYALLSLCLIVVHAALVRFLIPEVMEGTLFGTDSYSRLIRVAQLHESGEWFDTVIPRMNAPYGLDFHWTRPLDILLLVSSWLLSPIFGFQTALYWSGAFLSPILHIMTSLGLAWAVGPLFGAERRPLVVIVLLAQPIVTSFALAGRADHHMLLVLAYVLSLGFFFRLIFRPDQRWPALASGAMAGLGLWVSIEFLLPLITLYASLTLLWLVGFPRAARSGLLFSAGFAAVVGVALVVEHPLAMLLLAEYDRISAPHLLLSILTLGFWMLVLSFEGRTSIRESVRSRVILFFIWATVASGAFALTYPGVLSNPMTDVDPDFWTLFISHIEELQPLFPRDLSKVGMMVAYLGAAFLAIPFSLWMLLPLHGKRTRAAWLPVFVALCTFVPLGLYQVRYGIWAGVPFAIAVAGLLTRVIQRLEAIPNGFLRTLVRVTLIAGIITGPLLLGGLFMTLWGNQPPPSARSEEDGCSVERLASALSEGIYGEVPKTLVTFPDMGPELVYRTHHLVVPAPYHRNPAGILDTYEMLASTEDSVSRRLMNLRGVDLVILCPNRDKGFFQQVNASDRTLFGRLVKGREPIWLQSVELPGSFQSGFLVFEVSKE